VTSTLPFGYGCHDDRLFADVFLEDVGALLWCWVDFEYASTQYRHQTISLLRKLACLNQGEHI